MPENPIRFADGQQPAEPAIGRTVLRIAEQIRRAILESQAAANDQLHVQFACGKVRAHDPGKRVAVRDRNGGKAEVGGVDDEFVRVRGPFQKGKVGCYLQLGVMRWSRHGRLSSLGTPMHTGTWFWMAGSPAMT